MPTRDEILALTGHALNVTVARELFGLPPVDYDAKRDLWLHRTPTSEEWERSYPYLRFKLPWKAPLPLRKFAEAWGSAAAVWRYAVEEFGVVTVAADMEDYGREETPDLCTVTVGFGDDAWSVTDAFPRAMCQATLLIACAGPPRGASSAGRPDVERGAASPGPGRSPRRRG